MIEIDVIIPCFNSGTYLEKSVKSALAQNGDFKSLNVIVVDDHSSDPATHAALERVKYLDRVTVLSNTGAQGSAAARNLAIEEAKGNWIAFLDADDWWPDDSVKRRLDALHRFPDAEWIGGDFIEFYRDGTWGFAPRFERNVATYTFLEPAFREPKQAIFLEKPLNFFLIQAPTNTIVSLVKKSLLKKVGAYNANLLRQQDYHLFMRLAQAASFVFVPHVVAYYRLHESNSTRSLTETQEWRIKALRDLMARPEFNPFRNSLKEQIRRLHLSNSYEFRKSGAFFSAALEAIASMRTAPFDTRAWRSLAGALLHIG